jgi:hypothetical protein
MTTKGIFGKVSDSKQVVEKRTALVFESQLVYCNIVCHLRVNLELSLISQFT